MNKVFFIAIALCSLLVSCDVRKKDKVASLPSKAKREVKDPTNVEIIDSVYDFGKVKEGDIVEFSFRFKNVGTHPLVITEALASCGCTVAEKPEAPVLPGETGYIKAKFNTEGKPGESHKSITVTSNALPEFPQLLLKGTVLGKQE